MVNTTKSRMKSCTIAILGVALAALFEFSSTPTQDQENATSSFEEEQHKAEWSDLGHDGARPLSAGEKQRLEEEVQKHCLSQYDVEPAESKKTEWFEALGSGNPIMESVSTWLLIGIAIVLVWFYFALLLAAFAGIVTWGLACLVLLLVYGVFSGFEYSDHALSVISTISAVFVGIPVFIWVAFGGVYTLFGVGEKRRGDLSGGAK